MWTWDKDEMMMITHDASKGHVIWHRQWWQSMIMISWRDQDKIMMRSPWGEDDVNLRQGWDDDDNPWCTQRSCYKPQINYWNIFFYFKLFWLYAKMDLPKMLLVITKGINMVDFPRPIVIIMLVYPRPSSKQLDLNDKNGGSMGTSWNIPIFYIYYIYIYGWWFGYVQSF